MNIFITIFNTLVNYYGGDAEKALFLMVSLIFIGAIVLMFGIEWVKLSIQIKVLESREDLKE